MVYAVEFQLQRELLERIGLFPGEHPFFFHLLQHGVAAQTSTLIMAHRVIEGRILDHPHKGCSLLHGQLVGSLTEIHIGSRFDSDSVIQEVKLVEIHLYNLILRIVTLKFNGNHPFDRLLQSAVEQITG